MKRMVFLSKNTKVISAMILATASFSSPTAVLAGHCKKHHHCNKQPQVAMCNEAYKDAMPMPVYTFVPNWYVGAHIGVSRTHDKASPGSGNSVTQIGPGWTADLGYQFIQFHRLMLAAELGYTQYHNSNETTLTTNVASTEHFASYLAAVGQYPLVSNFSILGKLGVAYSYAKKVFTASGASASANTYSLYWGGGVAYNITPKAELDLQWARVRGNNKTGSTDLTSLGLTYHFL